jgi:hypothetical protein
MTVALTPLAISGCGPNTASPASVQIGTGGRSTGGGSGSSAGDGGITALATSLFNPQGIALSASQVYWTSTGTYLADGGGPIDAGTLPAGSGPGGVGQVNRVGGITSFAVEDLEAPTSLLYSNGALYWAQGLSGGASIEAFAIGGSAVKTSVDDQQLPLAIAMNSTALFWSSGSGAGLSVTTASLSGTSQRSLGSESGDYAAGGLTVDSTSVYVAASVGGLTGAVFSVPLNGGSFTKLWSGGEGPASDVAASFGRLYWTINAGGGAGEVLTMPTTGGAVTTLAAGVENPVHLVVDSTTVYFTSDTAAGALLSVPTTGGTVSVLAAGLDYPSALAVDDAVYLTTATAILKVPK